MSDRTASGTTDQGGAEARNEPDAMQAKPSAMQGREFLYGHLVAGVLIAVAIANFVLRHGTGAPKHPSTGLAVIGLVAALAMLPLLHTRNRFIAPFGAVIAAFLVTLPRGPNSLQSLHVLAIIFPLVYALLLTQRQRKAAIAQVKAGGGPRREARGRRRQRAPEQEKPGARPGGPARNRRYTPPKAKRAKR